MDKQTKVLVAVLAIFVIGMTMSVAFAEPVSATSYKYKGKKYITVKVKDGKKTHKIKCKFKGGEYQKYSYNKGKYMIEIGKNYKGKWSNTAVNKKTHKYISKTTSKPMTTFKFK